MIYSDKSRGLKRSTKNRYDEPVFEHDEPDSRMTSLFMI